MPDEKKKRNPLESTGDIIVEPMPGAPTLSAPQPHSLIPAPPVPINGAKPELGQHSMRPSFLLNHDNDYDKNTYTPEGLIQRGILRSKIDDIKTT